MAQYRVGQHVDYRDDHGLYGGGWIRGVIVEDFGQGAVEQYVVHIDGSPSDERARFGQLRPADGSPRPLWPTNDPQRRLQLNNYQPLEEEQPTTAAVAASPVGTASSAAPPAVLSPKPHPDQMHRNLMGKPAAGQDGSVPVAAALTGGKGMFPRGEKLGIPGQTNRLVGKDGKTHIVTIASPGTESCVGRWALNAGGRSSVKSVQTQVEGSQLTTHEYTFTTKADVLVINADGTWTKQFGGKKQQGRWIDLGKKVVQLVGFEEDDWTGSVNKGEMMIRSPLGIWEYGNRLP